MLLSSIVANLCTPVYSPTKFEINYAPIEDSRDRLWFARCARLLALCKYCRAKYMLATMLVKIIVFTHAEANPLAMDKEHLRPVKSTHVLSEHHTLIRSHQPVACADFDCSRQIVPKLKAFPNGTRRVDV